MDVSEGEQDAQEGVKGQNGMGKDTEFHFGKNLSSVLLMQEANLALREVGKGEAGQGKGSVTESLLGNGLGGTHCGNSMTLKLQVTLQGWWLCL